STEGLTVELSFAGEPESVLAGLRIGFLRRDRSTEFQLPFDVGEIELAIPNREMADGRQIERAHFYIGIAAPIRPSLCVAQKVQLRMVDDHLGQDQAAGEEAPEIERDREA